MNPQIKALFTEFPGCLATYFAIALTVGLVYYSQRNHHDALAGLPLREVVADRAAGLAASEELAAALGGNSVGILGTGSMAPFIPEARPVEVVAYAVLTRPDYESLTRGDLCLYRRRDEGALVLHQAAAKDRLGWIMSGLNNAVSDTETRMTRENYLGRVEKVFVWGTSL